MYTHFTSCQPLGVKKGFIKGDALPLLRTNSWKENFQNRLEEFEKHLRERRISTEFNISNSLWNTLWNRREALQQKPSRGKTILPFVTQYQPSVPSLKKILMEHWQLIESQPLLRQIYKEPPIISYKRGRSVKDILVKAKLWELKAISTWVERVCQACQLLMIFQKESENFCVVFTYSVTWARKIRKFHVVVV